MLMILTLLSLVSWIPTGITLFHACIPNSQFRVNGRLCLCDSMGRWNEASCQPARRQVCTPGQIIWEDCNQCICQETGHLICANMCTDETKLTQITKTIDVSILWCIPFVSYYINCSLCVCPASGKMNDARCATDTACTFRGSIDYLAAIKTHVCIPKVMYIFPCLRCLCSDEGIFILSKCAETCPKKLSRAEDPRKCSPKKFFRTNCNICFCPENGVVNERLCTKTDCTGVQFQSLVSLRNKSRRCLRQMFTGPKCFYCECGLDGAPNENACLETDCMGMDHLKYHYETIKCSAGEMVPNCMDCFCLRNGITDIKYCTKTCSNSQKLAVLDSAIKESFISRHIVNRKNIPDSEGDVCEPNSIYKENGKYCFCSENGETRLNLCTSVFTEVKATSTINLRGSAISIDFNAKCDPNTFVEFDCNTCYCSKSGRLNANWCTYDDCAGKRSTMEKNRMNYKPADTSTTECVPGSMSKVDCNFCICPENGQYQERICTKNSCKGIRPTHNELTCEPLVYFTVDCNICYCPKNGIKNIDKCTKQICEKNFLRSEGCVPGRLFSDECNVCVCPPNGNKEGKICTKNTCENSDTPWKKIFKLSQSLLSYQVDDARNMELCFPGEEFEVGCKVCLCPDMGLRAYATCTEFCNDRKVSEEVKGELISTPIHRIRRNLDCDKCLAKVDDTPEDAIRRSGKECEPCENKLKLKKKEYKNCTPGSMYIIKCQKCICPYMGSIYHFCRPLPPNMYCEQPYPMVDFMPMRRVDGDNTSISDFPTNMPVANEVPTNMSITEAPTKSAVSPEPTNTTLNSEATRAPGTRWSCDKPGRVMDACYICECANNFIIKDQCFHSDSPQCAHAEPNFLLVNRDT